MTDTINHTKAVRENLEWIKSGKMGCTFAALFARDPEAVGWKFITNPNGMLVPIDCLLLSLVFPTGDKNACRQWALDAGFYLEDLGDGLTGLRYKFLDGISWVQYFGPDADVLTRQTPYPMLTMSVKLPAIYYAKVGFKGILHVAHATIKGLSQRVADRLWDTSHTNTEKQLGHKPGLPEAAKTTYHG